MKNEMTYGVLVEQCKQLRGEAEQSEARFLAFLMTAERDHGDIWREAGCATFEQFLRSNTLCEPGRYRFFAIGVDRAGLDAALTNGAHWTIQAGRMPQPTEEQLTKFADRARAFVEVQRVAPSEEAVRTWAAEVRGGSAEPKQIRQASELHRLRAENVELRAKLRAAERRVSELEAKLAGKAGGKKRAA